MDQDTWRSSEWEFSIIIDHNVSIAKNKSPPHFSITFSSSKSSSGPLVTPSCPFSFTLCPSSWCSANRFIMTRWWKLFLRADTDWNLGKKDLGTVFLLLPPSLLLVILTAVFTLPSSLLLFPSPFSAIKKEMWYNKINRGSANVPSSVYEDNWNYNTSTVLNTNSLWLHVTSVGPQTLLLLLLLLLPSCSPSKQLQETKPNDLCVYHIVMNSSFSFLCKNVFCMYSMYGLDMNAHQDLPLLSLGVLQVCCEGLQVCTQFSSAKLYMRSGSEGLNSTRNTLDVWPP